MRIFGLFPKNLAVRRPGPNPVPGDEWTESVTQEVRFQVTGICRDMVDRNVVCYLRLNLNASDSEFYWGREEGKGFANFFDACEAACFAEMYPGENARYQRDTARVVEVRTVKSTWTTRIVHRL